MEDIPLDNPIIKKEPHVLSIEKYETSVPRLIPEMTISTTNPSLVLPSNTQPQDQYISAELYMEKNKELHKLTLKMKQYEFAIQEAIHFLSKPMNSYQDWIDREDSSNLKEDLAHSIPKGGRASTLSASAPAPNKITSFTSSETKQPRSSNVVEAEKKDILTDLELSCLENMRLCFNFLRNSQKSSKAIDDGILYIPPENQLKVPEKEPLSFLNNSKSALSNAISQLATEEKNLATSKNSINNIVNPSSTSYFYLNQSKYDDHDISGDLSLEKMDDFKPSLTIKSSCKKCRNALLMLDKSQDSLKAAEKKNVELEGRLQKEINARKVCQQAKSMIDSEIEEITAELFSRANQMVVDEAKRMDMLNTSNRELTKRVGDLTSRLKEKELELANAAKALYELQSHQMLNSKFSSGSESDIRTINSSLINMSFHPQQNENKISTKKSSEEFTHYIVSGFDQFKSLIAADGYIFQEFQDLIKVMVVSANLPSTQAFLAIQNTGFMKRCMIESVEPCLLYTYSPNSSFKQLGPGQSISFKRKILDQASKGHIACTPDQVSEGAPAPSKMKCILCTVSRICEYKLSFSETLGSSLPNPKAEPICRFCRDRILSVQDFFNYITFLSGGKHGQTILSAFKQVMWTRRRMALALIGSCSLFETETSAILGPGSGGNWEKFTKTLY